MKRLLLLFGAVAMALSALAAPSSGVRFVNWGQFRTSDHRAKMIARVQKTMEETSTVYKPGKKTEYRAEDPNAYPDGTVWGFVGEEAYTYDDKGLLIGKTVNEGDYKVTTRYEYDSEGRLVRETDLSHDVPLSKGEYVYDTVIENLVVRTTFFQYNPTEQVWIKSSEYYDDIKRDAAGNVTSVDSYYDGELDDRLVYTYGKDGKIDTIRRYSDDHDGAGVELAEEFVDIKWAKTNGQLVSIDIWDGDLTLGDNLIKSARMPKATNVPHFADIYFNVEYKSGFGGYKGTFTMNGEVFKFFDRTYTDGFGSYSEDRFVTEYTENSSGAYVADSAEKGIKKEVFDKFGLCLELLSEWYFVDKPENKDILSENNTVSYDEEYGYPVECIREWRYNDSYGVSREVWSDYQGFKSGITDVEAEAPGASVEYFNLQGVKVSNPSHGVYIRRQGETVEKVRLR